MNIPSIGIIGLGRQGKQHLSAFLTLEKQQKVKVVGICDVVPTDANTNIPFFTDYKQLLLQTNPDAVVIAVPNFLHTMVTRDALSHSCHVFKEKPLALNYVDGLHLVTLAEKSNRLLFTAQQRFYDPLFIKTKEELSSLGKLTHFSYTLTLNDEAPSWYWRRETGGGSWLNLGWHGMAVLHWLFGEITAVQLKCKVGGERSWKYDTDHSSFAKVTTQGVTGPAFFSCIYQKEETLRIVGTHGSVLLTRENLTVKDICDTFVYTRDQKRRDPYVLQAEDFLAKLQHHRFNSKKDLAILHAIQLGIDSLEKT